MNGCNGKMGQVINASVLSVKTMNVEIAAGFDVNDSH